MLRTVVSLLWLKNTEKASAFTDGLGADKFQRASIPKQRISSGLPEQ